MPLSLVDTNVADSVRFDVGVGALQGALVIFGVKTVRAVYVYVDGFNLFYRP